MGIMQDWRQLTSGKVSFIDEDRPNPVQILKQLRNLRCFQKGGMEHDKGKSWINDLHGEVENARICGRCAAPEVAGKWEALVKMAALGSLKAAEAGRMGDLEAADTIKNLLDESRATKKVLVDLHYVIYKNPV